MPTKFQVSELCQKSTMFASLFNRDLNAPMKLHGVVRNMRVQSILNRSALPYRGEAPTFGVVVGGIMQNDGTDLLRRENYVGLHLLPNMKVGTAVLGKHAHEVLSWPLHQNGPAKKIKEAMTKSQLQSALSEGRKVDGWMVLEGLGTVDVVIHGVALEDGSYDSWLIIGELRDTLRTDRFIQGYWSTARHTGTYSLVSELTFQ